MANRPYISNEADNSSRGSVPLHDHEGLPSNPDEPHSINLISPIPVAQPPLERGNVFRLPSAGNPIPAQSLAPPLHPVGEHVLLSAADQQQHSTPPVRETAAPLAEEHAESLSDDNLHPVLRREHLFQCPFCSKALTATQAREAHRCDMCTLNSTEARIKLNTSWLLSGFSGPEVPRLHDFAVVWCALQFPAVLQPVRDTQHVAEVLHR